MTIKSISASEYLTKSPVTLSEETDLFEAIHVLLEKKLTGLTIVNANNEVVGVLSELDCLKAILDGSYYGEVGGKVRQFMTQQVQTLENVDKMDVLEVARIMIDGKRRRIPVVENGQFKGQVSCRSILQAVKDFVGTHDASENCIYE
ncbi:CBS domain-containing protein [Gynuella sunshinyii]|uniref:CBS domain n=1 Tax=Gynuella sunshinyii YC6258 TaxID=1445510 RepID=A0A0C5VBS1_9GAMM|nr:CBS domain-containing protein [Gynuella sunshinyii]AJQ96760.1 CBS domain [Gynuella sunshinyii YC6258]